VQVCRNWDNDTIPDENSKIAIPIDPESNPDRFPVIGSFVVSAKAKKLIVDEGATITIAPGGTLIVIEE